VEELYTREHFVEILDALHTDQTGLVRSLIYLRRLVGSWEWATEGRGSYEWDDERYQQEFGYCIDAVKKAIDNALKRNSKAHELCCGRYRFLNRQEQEPVQMTFAFGRTYEQHRDEIMKAVTIG
jgi:hypothetical protein